MEKTLRRPCVQNIQRPRILLLDPRESSNIIGSGQELDVLYDWIKRLDNNIEVYVKRPNEETNGYGYISHTIDIFPDTEGLTVDFARDFGCKTRSSVFTQPPPNKSSPSLSEFLKTDISTCYFPGSPLKRLWEFLECKKGRRKELLPVPFKPYSPAQEKNNYLFSEKNRLVFDVTNCSEDNTDDLHTLLRLACSLHEEVSEIIILCKKWIPDINITGGQNEYRIVKVNSVNHVQRFLQFATWILLDRGPCIGWVGIQPAIHGLPHIMYADNPLRKSLGELPGEIQQSMVWDGRSITVLKKMIQNIIEKPEWALKNAKLLALHLQICDAVNNSRNAFYENVFGENIVDLKVDITCADKKKGITADKWDPSMLYDSVRPVLREKRNLTPFSSVVGMKEGSLLLQMYVSDTQSYESLKTAISENSIAQQLSEIFLCVWSDPCKHDVTEYAVKTSLQLEGNGLADNTFSMKKCDNGGNTLLHRSARAGADHMVNWCLEHGKHGFDVLQNQYYKGVCEQGNIVNIRNKNVQTPLHLASKEGHVDVCRILLDKEATVDAKDKYGSAPLHLASKEGQVHVCRILLDNNAAVNIREQIDQTPLHLASKEGYADVCRILLNGKADVYARDTNKQTPLHLASMEGRVNVCRILLDEKARIYACDTIGQTPLHLASKEGYADVCRILLNEKADVYARDTNGQTPLHLASMEGHADVCRVLLQENAAVDAHDRNQQTPLHLASKEGHAEVCRVLLDENAPVSARDMDGRTPLYLASMNDHTGVCQLLHNLDAATDTRD